MKNLIVKSDLFCFLCLILTLILWVGCDKPANQPANDNSGSTEETVESTEAVSETTELESVEETTAQTLNLGPKYKPSLYAEFPDDMYSPDAVYYEPNSKTLYVTMPNFNLDPETSGFPVSPACLVKVNPDGSAEKLVEFPINEKTGHYVGCMDLAQGPDGNLYVCDNQYFFETNYKSRIWRVVMKDGKPTGEFQVVVDEMKVPNGILWEEDRVFVTDTILDLDGKYGTGAVWAFSNEELLKAGTDENNPPIIVAKTGDPRQIIIEECENVRGNNCGADGIARDSNGIYYFGNYGDGAMFRFKFDENNKPLVDKIHKGGELFKSADGIDFDPVTNKVYITDSAGNAIWAFTPKAWDEKIEFERIWENDDTDGTDGLLDLPCDCVVVDGKLIISNQDIGVGETGKNQKVDKPYSLSVINLQ
ncbi:MAG: hypothetical protein Q4C95_08255 [Planctomycetia bacterium]|nr:hypothetical protein [Planctomycetia bacterium]